MFILNAQFQIAAICFFIAIVYDYLKSKKIATLSTKCFSAMLIFTGTNLIFDLITVYTIRHINDFDFFSIRIFHQIYICSLILIMVTFYLYVEILGKNHKRMKISKIIWSMAPFAVALIMVAVGSLHYYVDDNKVYSYGLMANAVYICIIFYILLIVVDTFLYKDNIRKDKRIAIRIGSVIWFNVTIVHYLYPNLLIGGLAVVLILLFVYLSFENPKELMDEDIGTFNIRAFHMMISDKVEAGKPLYVISVVVEDLDRIQTLFGHDYLILILENLGKMLDNTYHTRVYHIKNNILGVLVEDSINVVKDKTQELEALLNEPLNISGQSIFIKTHIDVLNTQYNMNSLDEVYEMMNYMAAHIHPVSESLVVMVDDKIMNKKLRYNAIEKVLHEAIDNNGFEVVFQPIYDVKTGRYHSAEALVRIIDTTTLGFISPEEFIPIAEKKGLIMELGRIVFEQVCQFASEKNIKELGIEFVEVNLSNIQCVHPDLPHQLQTIMEYYGIPQGFINLEMTETASVKSGEMLQRNMKKLRNIGCSFSMDDFGTGYSNLSQMADVVYDLVKIDKSLIWSYFYNENNKANAILENMIHMLIELKVKIVAEGVETKEMTDYLIRHGVTYLQGYYFSKPINTEEFISFLKYNNA